MSSTIVTYSHIQGIPLTLELWTPPSPSSEPLPLVLYYHGGALISGGKKDFIFAHWLKDASLKKGFAFAGVDYPLIIPFTSADILDQVKALFTFLASPSMPVPLDTSRIAVAGFSAGGYVARLAGIHAVPKPAAVVSAFGMGGDMLADALVFPRVHFPNPIPRAAAARILDDPSPEPSVNSPLSPDPQFGINDSNGRWLAGLWLASNGLFLDLLSGVEGLSEQLRALSTFEERSAKVKELGIADMFPEIALSEKATSFPPTFFYHGGADILVLPHESKKTYETLKQAGVETEMVVLPGAYHGMRDPSQPAQAMEGTEEIEMRAFDFLAKFLERD